MSNKILNLPLLRRMTDFLQLQIGSAAPMHLEGTDVKAVISIPLPNSVTRWAVNNDEGVALDGLSTYTSTPVAASATPTPGSTSTFDDFFSNDIRILNMPFMIRFLDVATVAVEIAANARISIGVFLEPIGTSGLDQGTLSGTSYYIGRGPLMALQAGQLDYILNPVGGDVRPTTTVSRTVWSGYVPAGWRCGVTINYSTNVFNTARVFPVGTGFGYQICGIKGAQGVPLPF